MSKYKTLESVISNPADRLEAAILDVEKCLKKTAELRMLRDRVENGSMTDELYAFINKDSSLENLFAGIPKLSTSASMEAIEEHRLLQLHRIDSAIEGVLTDTKQFLINLWRSFVEWIEDWIDANRRIKFRLQRHQRRMSATPLDYGTPEQFAKAKGFCYTYAEWTNMKNAAKALSALIKTVPASNPSKWFDDKHKELVENFHHFGWIVTDAAVRYDNPTYVRQDRAIGPGAAGWSISSLDTAISGCIADIDEERTARTEFQNIRRIFDKSIAANATASDKSTMLKLIKVCKGGKECTNVVARAVNEVANIALRCARSAY